MHSELENHQDYLMIQTSRKMNQITFKLVNRFVT